MKKKTRHVILYSTRHGRNDGSPLYYFEQLKKLPNTEVMHLDPELVMDSYGKFDYTWWVDWGEDAVLGREEALALKLPKDGGKTIYVASDTHLDDGYRFEKAKQFVHIFFNQKNAVDTYIKLGNAGYGQTINYLPHAAEPLAFPHFEIIKKYDLAFIGHMQEYQKGNGLNVTRLDALDYMFKAFPNFYYGSRMPQFPEKNMFEDAAKRFCESKIVFNISVGNDANMRFFETLSTGSFLLTNKIPELKNLEDYGFYEGRHYITYSSLAGAKELAKYYIEHDEEREAIAITGREQFLKTGTYASRIQEILKIVK